LSRTLIAWDIENINFLNYTEIKECLGDIDMTDKFFTHNDTHIPLKVSDSNFLINRGWSRYLVKAGKDSADHNISDVIKSNIDKYKRFIIITGDNGFSEIVSFLLEQNKEVVVVHNDRSDKLINKIHLKTTKDQRDKLLTLHCIN